MTPCRCVSARAPSPAQRRVRAARKSKFLSVGIKPDDPLLAPLKTYAEFPKNEDWLRTALEEVLKRPKTGNQP